MFIVERRGFRLTRGFYVLWFFLLLGAVALTMHVHYDPEYWKKRAAR
jgi:hypothetical protein